MALLYRGVSKRTDDQQRGELKPKGSKSQVIARYDGQITYDGRFTYGESEDNAVRAHHIKTGLYEGCYLSTTQAEEVAVYFATAGYSEEGWVYILDTGLFDAYGVISKELEDLLHPDQKEVTIRTANCSSIPKEVIIYKYEVDRKGRRKI